MKRDKQRKTGQWTIELIKLTNYKNVKYYGLLQHTQYTKVSQYLSSGHGKPLKQLYKKLSLLNRLGN